MSRLMVGFGFTLMGLVLALVGGAALGPDLHPIATGCISVGLVTTGVALAERRLDGDRPARASRLRES